jgi:glutathione S-transferase
MIEIHHIFPSRSLRVMWLLEELGVGYTLRQLSWPIREHNPEYLEISPAGTFPAVSDGNETWLESLAICELLARRYGGERLLPAPTASNYPRYLQWLWFGEATLLAQLANVMRYGQLMPEPMRIPRAVEDSVQAYASRLACLERALGRGDFILGNDLSLADLSIGYGLFVGDGVLGQGSLFGPAVRAYWEKLASRPALRVALAKAAPKQ